LDWTSVWLEPRTPIVLAPGETKPYMAMARQRGNPGVDVSRSIDLKVTPSDPSVVGVDREQAAFIGKAPGHSHVRLLFNEGFGIASVFVRPLKSDGFNGVWNARFTGADWEIPKPGTDYAFELNSDGHRVTGTVHASAWPGDAPVEDGKVEGDRVSFSMTGTS